MSDIPKIRRALLSDRESKPYVEQLRSYAYLLRGASVRMGARSEVVAILQAWEEGRVPNILATVHASAVRFSTLAQGADSAAVWSVAYDLLALAKGYSCPESFGHYYRYREALGLSFTEESTLPHNDNLYQGHAP